MALAGAPDISILGRSSAVGKFFPTLPPSSSLCYPHAALEGTPRVNDNPNHPSYTRGIPVSLSGLRRVDELARSLEDAGAAGDVGMFGTSDESGPQVGFGFGVSPAVKGFYARITGQSPAPYLDMYSFEPVYGSLSGGEVNQVNDPNWMVYPAGTYNAKEINGNNAVPAGATTGAIVWLVPSAVEGYFEFNSNSTGFWARITAQSGTSDVYSFAQVEDASPPNGWADVSGGITGTNNAEEVNDNTNVPVGATTGAIVWMRPNAAKAGWYEFTYTALTVQDVNPTTLTVAPTFDLQFDSDNGPVWHLTKPAANVARVKLNGWTGTLTFVSDATCGPNGWTVTKKTVTVVDGLIMGPPS